jgi:phosphate-selective porin OprO/OprP
LSPEVPAVPPHLAFETDGGLAIAVPWYLQWQWMDGQSDRTPIEERFGFRRARIGLEVERDGGLEFKAEYDWEAGQWTDVASGVPIGPGRLRIGQYRMPLGLEQAASNRDAVLLERGLPNALVYGRRIGIGYEWVADVWTLRAAAFGRNLGRTEEAPGLAIRGTWVPVRDDRGLVHLGLALGTEDLGGRAERFSARPDVGLVPWRIVDSGAIPGVARTDRYGLEAAWIRGPWSLQSEYIAARVDAGTGSATASGWYLMATWSPTGEARGYRAGLVRAPQPKRSWGAIELAARVGRLDLDRGFLDGGTVETMTVGANWYVNPALRVSANLVDVDSRRRGLDDDPRLVEFRIQTEF